MRLDDLPADAAHGIPTVSSDPAAEGAALEALAQSAWWLDDASTCLAAREKAYRLYQDNGDARGAARAATALGYDAALFGQGATVAEGWLSRARDLLARLPDTVNEHGWLAVRQSELALSVSHEPGSAMSPAAAAAAIGERLGNADLQIVGRALGGLALVRQGRPREGMARLNDAVAAALAGDVTDIMWVGKVCCWLVAACYETQDLPRALEWCARAEQVSAAHDLAPLFDVCRIMYASIQIDTGEWRSAETELTSALERMRDSRRGARTDAVAQLGELRRRQGRLDEADRLLAAAEFDPRAVVGRALILLERGSPTQAWESVGELLHRTPEDDLLLRARVLRAAVRCASAAGAQTVARSLAGDLSLIADRVGTASLRAQSAEAEALLATDEAAPTLWREAIRGFHETGMGFDEAESRLTLARILSTDDPAGSQLQARIAAELLSVMGTSPPATKTRSTGVLTAREVRVLRLVARGMTNAEIGRKLVISEHTVHRHVANILAKLDAPTRAAAVSIATRAQLL